MPLSPPLLINGYIQHDTVITIITVITVITASISVAAAEASIHMYNVYWDY